MSASANVRYLTAAEVQGLHDLIMKTSRTRAELLDEGKLESAVIRPRMLAYYEGADLIAQTAALVTGIALAYAYSDGNKRLSLVAGATFLRLNGYRIHADSPEFGTQIEAVVNRTDRLEVATERLVAWLRDHSHLEDTTCG